VLTPADLTNKFADKGKSGRIAAGFFESKPESTDSRQRFRFGVTLSIRIGLSFLFIAHSSNRSPGN
jgi:hypothetical protein